MKNETPYDAGDAKQVKKAKRESEFLADKKKRGIEHIVQSEDARYVLSLFLDEAKVFHPASVHNGENYIFEHGREQGFRQAGLWWLTNTLLFDPDIVRKLQTDRDSALNNEKETA